MIRKLANKIFLETGNALNYAELSILEKIHKSIASIEVVIKDAKTSTEESIRKCNSKIQELIRKKHLTKNNKEDRKQAFDTYVEKKNEKKRLSVYGVDHHDQELEHTVCFEYEHDTEKAIPSENIRLGEHLFNQSNQNDCAARKDEQKAVPKAENTSLSEHHKEEQLFEPRLNEYSSFVDKNNYSLIESGGCGQKEDNGLALHTPSLTSLKHFATQTEKTNEKQAISKPLSNTPQSEVLSFENISSHEDQNHDSILHGDGYANNDEQGTAQTNPQTSIKLRAKEISLLLQTEKLSLEEILHQNNGSFLEGGGSENKEDQSSSVKRKAKKTSEQQEITQSLKLIQEDEPSLGSALKDYISLLNQKTDSFLEGGNSENKEGQSSAVLQTSALLKSARAQQAMGTLKKEKPLLLKHYQKGEPSLESYLKKAISSLEDEINDSILVGSDCHHKEDHVLAEPQANSPTNVDPLAAQAVEIDKGVFSYGLKHLTEIREEDHQLSAQLSRCKFSNTSTDDFVQPADILKTFLKNIFEHNGAELPKQFFMSMKRKNMKRLDKFERKDVLLQGISHQEVSANSPTFEPYTQIAAIVNETLPDDVETLAQGSDIDEDEHHFFFLEQDEDAAIQDQDKKEPKIFRLNVVTAEVFENAMRQYQIENFEITHTNYFPRNCRMFLHIPVLKGGFINRRDNKDRR